MDKCIDTPKTAFVHMLVERQNNCEQAIEQFISQRTIPDLFLLPHTNYQYFNDGYKLLWTLFDDVKLRSPPADGNRLVDIDDAHADAVVLAHGITIVLPIKIPRLFYLGHPMKPLIVKDLIKQAESYMIDQQMPGSNMIWRDAPRSHPMFPINKDSFCGLHCCDICGSEPRYKLII